MNPYHELVVVEAVSQVEMSYEVHRVLVRVSPWHGNADGTDHVLLVVLMVLVAVLDQVVRVQIGHLAIGARERVPVCCGAATRSPGEK